MDTMQEMYNGIMEPEVAASISAFDLALKGGWIMLVLLILLLVAVYVLIERALIIKKAGQEDNSFMTRIKDYMYDGKVDAALSLCRSTNTP